jgi:hypothetical protein
MARKQSGEKRVPLASRVGRVMCTDGYSRILLLANIAQVCGACGKVIEAGSRFTMRRMSGSADNMRSPVCQRCGPFGDGARAQMRRARAATLKGIHTKLKGEQHEAS